MRSVFASALASLLLSAGWAQKRYEFTAREAADHALKNVTEIKNLKIDKEIRIQSNREITGSAYPKIGATLGAQKFFKIPVTLLPDFISPQVYNVLQEEGVKDGNGNSIIAPTGPPQFFPAQFGVPWQASAGFSFQQLLFQPDVFVGLQARTASLKLADINIKLMEDSVKSNVLRAYYGVLIAEKRRSFLKQGTARLEKLLQDQEKLFQNGFIERLDLDKTRVSLNNLVTGTTQLDNLIYIGYSSLKYAVGLSQKDTLVLKDTLSTDLVKEALLDGSDFKYEDRNEIRLINTAEDLQRYDLKRYKLAYAPTVAAFWNYSRNALRQEFNFFNRGLPWFPTSVAGVSINLPIFEGFQRDARIRQAQLRLDKTVNDRENLQRVIDFQREAAVNVLRNSLSTLDVQERNMQLAEKVYLTTKKKYEQGLGSSFEVLQAESEYETAQGNYFQALYDAVNAKIGYYRSIGRL